MAGSRNLAVKPKNSIDRLIVDKLEAIWKDKGKNWTGKMQDEYRRLAMLATVSIHKHTPRKHRISRPMMKGERPPSAAEYVIMEVMFGQSAFQEQAWWEHFRRLHKDVADFSHGPVVPANAKQLLQKEGKRHGIKAEEATRVSGPQMAANAAKVNRSLLGETQAVIDVKTVPMEAQGSKMATADSTRLPPLIGSGHGRGKGTALADVRSRRAIPTTALSGCFMEEGIDAADQAMGGSADNCERPSSGFDAFRTSQCTDETQGEDGLWELLSKAAVKEAGSGAGCLTRLAECEAALASHESRAEELAVRVGWLEEKMDASERALAEEVGHWHKKDQEQAAKMKRMEERLRMVGELLAEQLKGGC
ncbi:hypothetical protein DCS_04211 [Drechmeria coniospora]|uniref:Uncharacterized protein n=1 Tax=Drechmeria coniospora TaxID=98403 RepID=A0A151GJC3_DRECN|nr:hypothetical protein DCS_04211 [Drechmeria coniospora]KYK57204.1 hypothetical protein DCS_04211 [Drechmeria coniospora]